MQWMQPSMEISERKKFELDVKSSSLFYIHQTMGYCYSYRLVQGKKLKNI